VQQCSTFFFSESVSCVCLFSILTCLFQLSSSSS
jgi:hypothetical protein